MGRIIIISCMSCIYLCLTTTQCKLQNVLMHVCTLVNVEEKHHQRKLQVMPTASASEVFALIDGRKNTTSASCRVSRPSCTSRNRLQQPNAGSTRASSS